MDFQLPNTTNINRILFVDNGENKGIVSPVKETCIWHSPDGINLVCSYHYDLTLPDVLTDVGNDSSSNNSSSSVMSLLTDGEPEVQFIKTLAPFHRGLFHNDSDEESVSFSEIGPIDLLSFDDDFSLVSRFTEAADEEDEKLCCLECTNKPSSYHCQECYAWMYRN